MLSVDLEEVKLVEEVSELDPTHRVRYGFPLSSAQGTADTTAVILELEPGKRLSRHTDSAEELLVVLDGTIEARVGDEKATAGPGTLVLVPPGAPHEVRNVGAARARILGVFGSATVVSVFEQPTVAGGEQVFVTGAPVPLAAALARAPETV